MCLVHVWGGVIIYTKRILLRLLKFSNSDISVAMLCQIDNGPGLIIRFSSPQIFCLDPQHCTSAQVQASVTDSGYSTCKFIVLVLKVFSFH